MKSRLLLTLLLVCGCTTPKSPVVQPPLVVPPPPAPDETPAIRAVLDPFLAARWSFDYEALPEFVTAGDAAEPWHNHAEQQLAKMRHADIWMAHTWSIRSVDVDDDVAVARVEVIGPGMHDAMHFQMRTSLRTIKATTRWLRDPKKQQAELSSVAPPRRVRLLTYQLRKVQGAWRVFMDWPGMKAIAEAPDDVTRREMFGAFEGSEKELHQQPPPLDDRTQALLQAVDEAERAVRDRDYQRARELYDVLLVSDTAIPDFLATRRDSFDALQAEQQTKLNQAKLEVGPLREVDGKFELRVKNHGADLRSFRLVAEYVDNEGERTYRSVYEQKLLAGESRTVLVHPRQGQKAALVRLVNVRFLDREVERKFHQKPDPAFQMRLQDLRTNGESRASAHRIASVIEDHQAQFDACPWPEAPEPIDIWIEVENPPRARAVRSLVAQDSELGKCLSETASSLGYPDAANNRSVVRVYPRTHWWRQD